jgi:hypothetical protein
MNDDIKMHLRPGCGDAHWLWAGASGGQQLIILFLLEVNLFGVWQKNPVQPVAIINKLTVNVLEARRSGILWFKIMFSY